MILTLAMNFFIEGMVHWAGMNGSLTSFNLFFFLIYSSKGLVDILENKKFS